MLDGVLSAFNIIKEYTSKTNIKESHKLILQTPPQYTKYYSPTRLYNENEILNITKAGLAELGIIEFDSRYATEKVKFVSQQNMTELVDLSIRTQFRAYQNLNEISYWLKYERILTGCKRISIENDKIYVAIVDIPLSDVDPALTLPGKWEEDIPII